MDFGKAYWRTFEQGIEREWLLTNGIGGFASSTIIGANTRRYHGLLVASLKPPTSRHLILSKIDESVAINGKTYNIYSFQTHDYIMPGYLHLQRVSIDHIPTFTFSMEDVFIEKKISMVYGENTVAVVYHVINGAGSLSLRLTPLLNFRDYHHNSSREHMKFKPRVRENTVLVNPYNLDLNIRLYCSSGNFNLMENSFFLNMFYAEERERGLQPAEDHYIPGYYDIDVRPYEEKHITVIATVEDEIKETDGLLLIDREENRLKSLEKAAGYEDEFARRLVAAADGYIVHRQSTDAKTIIAGYPWFTDWGRDTMIAFPGLTLVTGRFSDAKEILFTFARYVKNGLVPNMFPDGGQEPIYNSVDAALWYFEAVKKYVEYTGDSKFVCDELYEILKDMVEAFIEGTLYNIKMDRDHLISAGSPDIQLTWMDAKIGDWVVTPRHGKAVEINALWYNALKIMEDLADACGDEKKEYYRSLADGAKGSFSRVFWNDSKQCLYDVVTGDFKDDRVRPNQILSLSLTYPVIEGDMAKKIVETVWKELYTAYGLRSLSPLNDGYRGIYTGDQFSRDSAYHQGTVWTWPLGRFITAYRRVYGHTMESKEILRNFIDPLKDHLNDRCIGHISEIFDGNEPLVPRGCFAQAWSVGEILRTYIEDIHGK